MIFIAAVVSFCHPVQYLWTKRAHPGPTRSRGLATKVSTSLAGEIDPRATAIKSTVPACLSAVHFQLTAGELLRICLVYRVLQDGVCL